uniref:Uncharacterized protein n=1 Tax=candidate division CPR3 bacterium TaxID=2268181 RepID=A0A7V3N4S3_UNCC3
MDKKVLEIQIKSDFKEIEDSVKNGYYNKYPQEFKEDKKRLLKKLSKFTKLNRKEIKKAANSLTKAIDILLSHPGLKEEDRKKLEELKGKVSLNVIDKPAINVIDNPAIEDLPGWAEYKEF